MKVNYSVIKTLKKFYQISGNINLITTYFLFELWDEGDNYMLI